MTGNSLRIWAFVLLFNSTFQQESHKSRLTPSHQRLHRRSAPNYTPYTTERYPNKPVVAQQGFPYPYYNHHHHYTDPLWGNNPGGGRLGLFSGEDTRGFTKYSAPKPFRDNDFNISLVPVAQDRNNTTKRKSDNFDPSTMVFPTESPAFRPINPHSLSKNCSFGLCDRAGTYPTDKIERIIARSKELQQYFHDYNKAVVDINSRFGDEGEGLCPTMVYTKFPETAVNTDNVEKYLVNVKDYKQGIMYETCEQNGGPCKFAEIFPNSYVATCKQKYTIRRLMTVTKESSEAVFDNFELPSCCVCMIKKS